MLQVFSLFCFFFFLQSLASEEKTLGLQTLLSVVAFVHCCSLSIEFSLVPPLSLFPFLWHSTSKKEKEREKKLK